MPFPEDTVLSLVLPIFLLGPQILDTFSDLDQPRDERCKELCTSQGNFENF